MQQNLQVQNVPEQFQQVVKEDIEKRKADPIDIRSEFENIISSTNIQDIQSKGVNIIGKTIVTPSLLDKARKDNSLKTKLFLDYKKSKKPFVQDPTKPVVGLSGVDFSKIDTSSFDSELKTTDDFQQLIDSVKDRQAIAKVFGPNSLIPLKGKQMIVDMFQTGSMYDELSRAVKSIPGDVLRLPNLLYMIQAGGRAAVHGALTKEDGATGAKFAQLMNNPMLVKYNAALNSNVVTRDAASRIQQWYKDTYIKQFGEDAYKADHQQMSYKTVEGRITPEFDQQGNIVYTTRDLDMGVAADLLDLSYNKLTGTEKSALFFSSIAPLTMPSRIMRSYGSLKLYEKVSNEREQNAEGTRGKSDYEVLNDIKNQKGKTAWKYWRKGWQAISISGDKQRLVEADNIMEHTANISRYDNDITSYTDEITSLNTRIRRENLALKKAPKELKGEIKNKINLLNEDLNKATLLLAKTKDARKSYVRKAGTGRFDNPYLRAVAVDDVLISSAMGYGSEFYGWMNQEYFGSDPDSERYAEMMIGLFAPFVTPSLIPLAAKGTVAIANFATGGEGVKDMAMALQNSKWLPMIKPGDLYNGDEVRFGKIIEEINIREGKKLTKPTKEQMESFRIFSNIFRNMRPEFREKAYSSILRYNKSMDTFESEMKKIFLKADGTVDDQLVAQNMSSLQLSMAEVTGLAPLISYYNRVGNSFSSSEAVKNIDELTAMALAQEDKLNGVSVLLNTIKESIRKTTGSDIDANTELSQTFTFMENMIANNKTRLNKEKQHITTAIEMFEKDIGISEINTDTLNTVVRLKGFLKEGRDFANEAERGNAIVETYNNIMTSANQKLEEIKANAADLNEKEMKFQIRRVADVMFDMEYGRKRAEASGFYKDIDKFAADNNIKIDFTDLLEKFINASDELRDKPLTEIFGSGTDFMNTVGMPMKKAFTKMATNALMKTYSPDALKGIRLTLQKQGINVGTDLDLALYLAQQQRDVIKGGGIIAPENKLNFFDGTVSEAEDMMRYFRDRGLYSARVKNADGRQIISDHMRLIDEAILKAGGQQLLDRVKLARSKYSSIMGETNDAGLSYGFDVIQNRTSRSGRTRKDRERIDVETEGNYKVRVNSKRPEAVFYNIANLSEKFVKAKTVTEKADILNDIADQKNRFMHFLGATMVRPDGSGKPTYAFDLTKPRQAKVAEMAENILTLAVNRTLRGGLEEDAKTIKQIVDAGKGNKYANFDSLAPENYNFVQAMNITEIENKLTVPVLKGYEADGRPIIENRKLLTVTDVDDLTIDLKDRLKSSQKMRSEYLDLKKEIEDKSSATRIAGQKLVDDQQDVLSKLERTTSFVRDPKRFFKEHFENRTADDIDNFVDDLVSQGMKRSDANRALKYMYMRGLFEISGETKTLNALSEFEKSPVRSEITDVQKFVNAVIDGKQKEVATRVLGHDTGHVKFLEEMASWVTQAGGNPRGFAPRGDTKGMTVDNIFSRVFNLARGMVSPLYVGTEIATRLLLEKNQTLLSVALKDRESARVLAEILKRPDSVQDSDIKTLAQRIKIYVAAEIIQNKNTQGIVPTLSEFIGSDDETVIGSEEDLAKQQLGIPSEKFTKQEVQ